MSLTFTFAKIQIVGSSSLGDYRIIVKAIIFKKLQLIWISVLSAG